MLRFGEYAEFELDDSAFELRRRGELIPLDPKPLELLVYLVRHRGRLVTKDELLREVWPGVTVSESVLPSNVAALRRALGDAAGRDGAIQTVYGRGYRFAAPVAAPEREPAAAEPTPTRPEAAPAADPFVGRDAVLAELRAAVAEAGEGRGRALALVGEAGIGKTRTAEEAARLAERAGQRVVTARCHEGEGAPAFWPWLQVLRELLAGEAPEEPGARELAPALAAVAPLVPGLRERLAAADPLPALPPDQERFRLFDAIARILLAESRRRPLLLVIDDLHWADEASQRLLDFLASELGGAPLLLLVTLRPEASDSLERSLAQLARQAGPSRIDLHGLASEEVREVVSARLPDAPPELSAALFERTGGNPFFLRETLRWLAGRGDAEAWSRASRETPGLPPSVRAVIERRLAQLSDDCRQVLERAAVIGREFELAWLEKTVELTRDALLDALDQATQARVVAPAPAGVARYVFSHALVRDALYEGIAPGRRVRLHRDAGLALEALRPGGGPSRLAELAHHFFVAAPAGEGARALDYAQRAARAASELLAHEEAVAHYRRALELLDLAQQPAEARLALLLALGRAHHAAGQGREERSVFRQAAELARKLDRPRELAQAAIGYTPWTGAGIPTEDDPGVRALLEETLDRLPPEPTPERARVLARLATLTEYHGPLAPSGELAAAALEVARASKSVTAQFEALHAKHWRLLIGCAPDRMDERGQISEELERIAERAGRPDLGFLARRERAGDALIRGDIGPLRAYAEEAARLAEATRLGPFRVLRHAVQTSLALVEGRLADAERELRAFRETGRDVNHPWLHPTTAMYAWGLSRDRGRPEDLATAEGAALGRYGYSPYARAIAANACAEIGDPERARELYESVAGDGLAELPQRLDWLITLAELSGACAALGDVERALELRELLLPYVELHALFQGPSAYGGPVERCIALLDGLLGERERADFHFESALQRSEGVGAAGFSARILCEHGALLLRGSAVERERGRQLAAEAAARAEALGMHGVRVRAKRLAGG